MMCLSRCRRGNSFAEKVKHSCGSRCLNSLAVMAMAFLEERWLRQRNIRCDLLQAELSENGIQRLAMCAPVPDCVCIDCDRRIAAYCREFAAHADSVDVRADPLKN